MATKAKETKKEKKLSEKKLEKKNPLTNKIVPLTVKL